jgi:hypothetical protein
MARVLGHETPVRREQKQWDKLFYSEKERQELTNRAGPYTLLLRPTGSRIGANKHQEDLKDGKPFTSSTVLRPGLHSSARFHGSTWESLFSISQR